MAGSVVSYSNQAKEELLGVDPALIEAKGAVSPEVAEAMAIGALERFGADVAVSITGIAGPDGGTEEKPVGYVCFNARLADGTAIAREPVIPGRPADIRERSALVAMHLLRTLLGADEPRCSWQGQKFRFRAPGVRKFLRCVLIRASAPPSLGAWSKSERKDSRRACSSRSICPDGLRGHRGLG